MGRIIICGDIHGSYKALLQCLERSNFDYENDTLIQLGDICDGWNEVYEVVEELLKIKNLVLIKGNHDDWFNQYIELDAHPVDWLQGGQGTLHSYCKNLNKAYSPKFSAFATNLKPSDIPESHVNFFKNQLPYYKDKDNNIFVHGGFNRQYTLANQIEEEIFWWDRDLWKQALAFKSRIDPRLTELNYMETPINKIYIGHTTTLNQGTTLPIEACNIINLDTGGGFKGVLSFYDLNTKEVWQSDNVNDLHKDWKGR